MRYAFFDVDGTLLKFTSMINFIDFFFQSYYGKKIGKIKSQDYTWRRHNDYKNYNRDKLNRIYYANYRGIEEQFLQNCGKKWFNEIVLNDENAFNLKVIKEIKKHQNYDDRVVFVSGSFFACLDPIAEYLNVQHCLCIKPIVKEGCLTGEIEMPQTIGKGKAEAIRLFLDDDSEQVLSESYAYGDHISDLDMLSLVGHPRVVASDPKLIALAKENNWKILS